MARRVLLDALVALAPFNESLILVGAQAVYYRTGPTAVPGTAMTSDGDLAVDAEVLAAQPEITSVLGQAGFVTEGNAVGRWRGEAGVYVDLMVAPHQGNRPPNARAADLRPHERFARITPGLAPSLVDNSWATLSALEPNDSRTVDVRIAGGAALFIAKLIKIEERALDARNGRKNRLRSKDALDILRLLQGLETEDLQQGLGRHQTTPQAAAETHRALAFLRDDITLGDTGVIPSLISSDPLTSPTELAAYRALVDDLLAAV